MTNDIKELQRQLREANKDYATAKKVAEKAEMYATDMMTQRLEAGRRIGLLRAAIKKLKEKA